MDQIENFSDYPLAEGFYADKVVKEKNVELGSRYFSLIPDARSVLRGEKLTSQCVEALHRYNRIMKWVMYQYGKVSCTTKEEFDIIFKAKVFDLLMFEGDCWLFWEWLRKATLEESSTYGGMI